MVKSKADTAISLPEWEPSGVCLLGCGGHEDDGHNDGCPFLALVHALSRIQSLVETRKAVENMQPNEPVIRGRMDLDLIVSDACRKRGDDVVIADVQGRVREALEQVFCFWEAGCLARVTCSVDYPVPNQSVGPTSKEGSGFSQNSSDDEVGRLEFEAMEVEQLTESELGALREYSHSLPTGTTIGKRWKRRTPHGWTTGEYVPGNRPEQPSWVGIKWRRVDVVRENTSNEMKLSSPTVCAECGK